MSWSAASDVYYGKYFHHKLIIAQSRGKYNGLYETQIAKTLSSNDWIVMK